MFPRSRPDLAELARHGDLDGLLSILHRQPHGYRLAYKWLIAAADFGHTRADDLIDALYEDLPFRADDAEETGRAHFELGVAYLTGSDGLPRDLARGRAHWIEAVDRGYSPASPEAAALLGKVRSGLDAEAREAFDQAIRGFPHVSRESLVR